MKLGEIVFGNFKRFLASSEHEDVYIIIDVPTNSPILGNLDLLVEGGQWKEDPDSKLSYRVDPAGALAHQRRHIHIAGKKHIDAKNKQVAWNDDGKRHDKKSFNTGFHGVEQAKSLARSVLKIAPNIPLEQFVPGLGLLLEGATPEEPRAIYLRV